MRNIHSFGDTQQLNITANPSQVWGKVESIVGSMLPTYRFSLSHCVFKDVLRLFYGQYPGYSAIKTPYHNLRHTLDVLLCSVRLMHGVHVSGTPLRADEVTLVMLATMLHDIGYAQRVDEEYGSGAQYTLTHVGRGIEFMKNYMLEHQYPTQFTTPLACLMSSTNPGTEFSDIDFPDERVRLLAQIVGSADILGQMADRAYLEKLMFLYEEFKEANFGNYESTHDLLCKTKSFYALTRSKKLDGTYAGIYQKLSAHFKAYMGQDTNYYIESIDKNINYLSKVIAHNHAEFHTMLKRGTVAEKSSTLKQATLAT